MKRLFLYVAMAIILVSGCSGNDKKNTPPIANAGADRTVSIEELVELDGSLSSDPDGDRLSYEWTLVSQPEGAAPVFADAYLVHPIFIAYEKGDYWFSLRVFDGKDWSEPDQVQVKAEASAFEPTAKITVTPETPKKGEPVYVSGKTSTDPNNDPLNYYWDVVLSPHSLNITPFSQNFFFSPEATSGALYRFALRVDDARFASDYAYADIRIANTPPVVNAGADVQLNGSEPPYYAGLNANASDADGDSLTYEWIVLRSVTGSNPRLSNPNILDPLFTTDREGFYVLRFRAFDGISWSIPDYITLCKGTGCPDNSWVYIETAPDQHTLDLHPYFDSTSGRYSAYFTASSLTIIKPADANELRWVVLWCPTGTDVTVLDPQNPANSNITFKGDINMVNSFCILRLEADFGQYSNDHTYIKSSSDTSSNLMVNFVNASPVVSGEDVTFTIYPNRVFQRIPLSITAEDPDGDTLGYYWSIVSKPVRSQAFFSSDSNRPDPVLYAGKEKDALGEYTIRVIVEDTLGGSAVKDIKLTIKE